MKNQMMILISGTIITHASYDIDSIKGHETGTPKAKACGFSLMPLWPERMKGQPSHRLCVCIGKVGK
jgi:hypothetical protein